jgi:hypothetical protein
MLGIGRDVETRIELRRITGLLLSLLAAQCEKSTAEAANPLRLMAIDGHEAELLATSLHAELAQPAKPVSEAHIPDQPSEEETPLARARRVFEMQPAEFDALVLALAVEVDPRFSRIVAYLGDHISRTRPTVGLALALADAQLQSVEFALRPALRKGLLQLEGDGPLPSQSLRIAPEFLPRFGNSLSPAILPASVRHRDAGPGMAQLVIGDTQGSQLTRWARQRSRPLVLAGAAGAGRATAACAASLSVGRPLIEFLWIPGRSDLLQIAAREALWLDGTLLIRPPETAAEPEMAELWPTLAVWDLPIAFAVPPRMVEMMCAAAPVQPIVIHLAGTTVEQREILWDRMLPGALSARERAELAARYDFLPGSIAQAIRAAEAEQAACPDFGALARSCRAVGAAGMGPLAQRLSQPFTRGDLILPSALHEELDLASAWVRNRRRVFEQWGFGRRIVLGQGLTALFSGEPGTGKTMAAQVLARELGLELYRVDLSRVMSKFIGETEKNLARLFDDARASGAILFFDEADALFGKRSEVKDAHDRYANLEISYLLQRMEEHVGITVLATNRMRDLDEAFTRRFHFILAFPMPAAPERRLIWQGMIPRAAEVHSDIDLDSLALNYDLSGGEIRNAVMSAAFMAAREGSPIAMRHLKRGLRRELLKMGRMLDARQRAELES